MVAVKFPWLYGPRMCLEGEESWLTTLCSREDTNIVAQYAFIKERSTMDQSTATKMIDIIG